MNVSRREFLKLAGSSAASLAMLSRMGALPPVLAQDSTTVTFGGWGGVAEDEGVKAAIEVFQAENPDIQVVWQHTPSASEYSRVTLTNIAAGTAPDTSFIRSDDYTTLAAGGVLKDITDLVKNDPLLGTRELFHRAARIGPLRSQRALVWHRFDLGRPSHLLQCRAL